MSWATVIGPVIGVLVGVLFVSLRRGESRNELLGHLAVAAAGSLTFAVIAVVIINLTGGHLTWP